MLPPEIVFISIFTSLFAGYFYLRDTWQGRTKPNRITWLIWVIAPAVAAGVQLQKGAGLSALPILMAGIVPFFVFIISFKNKNSYWKLGVFDYVCLILSLLAIFFWLFLQEGVLATVLAILADLIAFAPTYKKSWNHPDTETLTSYASGSFNALLSLLTLSIFSFNTAGFAIYLFFCNLIEVLLTLYRRKKLYATHS